MSIADVLSGAKRWHVAQGDALAMLASLPDACVDAVVTDPPAGIGFMGKTWDGNKGGRDRWIAWLSGVLREALRASKPGARMFCWAIPRTCGWTQMAIEDAGWLVESCAVHLFGSGFPKGKGQMKPAAEFWFLARKPGGKVPALNVDACRVESPDADPTRMQRQSEPTAGMASLGRSGLRADHEQPTYNPAGRWPPNVLLSHADGCKRIGTKRVNGTAPHGPKAGNGALGLLNDDGWMPGERAPQEYADPDGLETVTAYHCVDGCPVKALDEQSGERPTGGRVWADGDRDTSAWRRLEARGDIGERSAYDRAPDTGTASRFFPQFQPDEALSLYAAKASRADRTNGGTVENKHPTVKGQAIMRWLCRLITPPGGVVLDPFAGSGSTGVAAVAEGFRFVGIEREAEHVEVARRRFAGEAPLLDRCANVEAGHRPEPRPLAQQALPIGGTP